MVVGRHYMLSQPAEASRAKLFLDQKVIPFAIDVFGGCEVYVQRLSARTGCRPAVLLGAAVGSCVLLAATMSRRRIRAARY